MTEIFDDLFPDQLKALEMLTNDMHKKKATTHAILEAPESVLVNRHGEIVAKYNDREKRVFKEYLAALVFLSACRTGFIWCVETEILPGTIPYIDIPPKEDTAEIFDDLDSRLGISALNLHEEISALTIIINHVPETC